MKNQYHISRNFVEFGPFTALEIVGFKERKILNEQDYVREDDNHHWMHLAQWTKGSAAEAGKVKPTKDKPMVKAKSAAARKGSTAITKTTKNSA